MIDIKTLVKEEPLLLDGATGTNMFAAGMPAGICPEAWICEHPDVLLKLQTGYVAAGSRILYAPTFSGNRIKLAEYGLRDKLEEINAKLVGLSRKAAQTAVAGREVYVAGNLTMTGQSLKPIGPLDFEELVDVYKEQARAIAAAGVDLFVIETMMSLAETRAAVLAVKETTDLPVIVTMSFDESGRTLYGTDPVTALVVLQALGVEAFGMNCSSGPREMLPWMEKMRQYAHIPLIAKPNAGLPTLIDGHDTFDMGPEEFEETMMALVGAGASVIGGCCGTTPEYIGRLKQAADAQFVQTGRWAKMSADIYTQPLPEFRRVLTSECGRKELTLEGTFTVVGERINPTGKKKMQAALRADDMEMVCEMAESQTECGAGVLDINVGMPGIDEKSMMLEVLEQVGSTVTTPLCIDSSDPKVLEAALRVYPGRALVNSASAEKIKLEQVLPLVKKYGAMCIVLPMSDAGIPSTVAERLENIQCVLDHAFALGLTKEDIVVDGLVGAVGALPNAGRDTLDTIAWCKAHEIATICGLSNISFGLPDRSYVNSIFLALAISRGLTMAIANPSQELLMRSGFAADLLMAKEGAQLAYIEASQTYDAQQEEKKARELEKLRRQTVESGTASGITSGITAKSDINQRQSAGDGQMAGDQGTAVGDTSGNTTGGNTSGDASGGSSEAETKPVLSGILAQIHTDVLKGYSKRISGHVAEALESGVEASDILNDALIPAINLVGDYFSQQKYFLPQLMMSADTMRKAVDDLEPVLKKNQTGQSGPVVVIATVKGDVHDIGKNLVAMMMRNYGFDVHDMGKDVDKETIIEAAEKYDAQIICLSALMTTTMQYMSEVIEVARVRCPKTKVIIGGAATTESFAEEIGADGYSADAVGAVALVKRLLNIE